MTVNIALTGALRSGKSTVGDYLHDKYGYTQFAFGDDLKRYAHELFDVPREPKPRKLYQTFGQLCREIDPDIWVSRCFRTISQRHYDCIEYSEDPDLFRAVICDLRQPNEEAECRRRGYVIIRINSPSALRIHRAVQSSDTFSYNDLAHETESHVDRFTVDYDIYNVGTLDDLYAQIDTIMAALNVDRTV